MQQAARLAAILGAAVLCHGERLGRSRNRTSAEQIPLGFADYYNKHVGRGIWKWNVALEAYQRHFGPYSNMEPRVMEIGVQSGGSINMFETIYPKCHYYGVDINKNCLKFQDQRTTIFIGDQASVPDWSHFFSSVSSYVDIAIDDGGHQAHQMLTTIQQVLPKVRTGGTYFTEDIHGQNDDYLSKFLQPAAETIAGMGAAVTSVHLYPFMLGVQLGQGPVLSLAAPARTTASLEELAAAIPQHPGGVVALSNPSWGSLHTADALKNVMGYFYGIYGGAVREEPPHCHNSMSNECVMIVTNTAQQNTIKAIHVQPTQILVEVHAAPPIISATRRGSQWIPYAG